MSTTASDYYRHAPAGHTATRSGVLLDLLHPDPALVAMPDVAAALGRIYRFAGRAPWSVAQHSLLVARMVSRERRACALVHDAHEAYTGDLTRQALDALAALAGGSAGGHAAGRGAPAGGA